MPIEVDVESWHLERKGQQLIAEMSVENARVSLRHGQDVVRLADHRASREVILTTQPNAATQIAAAEREFLRTQAAAARRHCDVFLRQIGLEA